jgi:signal transduction histidine kinase/HD-like signal output (HDOD) protein
MSDSSGQAAIAGQVELSVGRLDALATLPSVAAQYLTRLVRPEFSPAVVLDIIESDPCIACRFFTILDEHHGDGSSFRRAIEQLPADVVRNTLLSLNVLPVCDAGDEAADKIEQRAGLLLHGLAVACCARAIAEVLPSSIDAPTAYYAGLLHDIGKFAIAQALPRGFARIIEQAQSAGQNSCSIEQEQLGIDHAIVGKRLSQRWRLPHAVYLATWLHHSDTAAIAQAMPEARIAQVVQLADGAVRHWRIGSSGSFDSPEPLEESAASLGLDASRCQRIRQDVTDQVRQKAELLGLDRHDARSAYCESLHAAALRFARQQSELSAENRQLQIASSHFDFAKEFLLGTSEAATALDLALNLAKSWQRFYQTGKVCLYLAPAGSQVRIQAAIVEDFQHSRLVCLDAPQQAAIIPKTAGDEPSILEVDDQLDWLFDQLDVEFDVERTKLVPLSAAGKLAGAIAFELRYPGDVESFADRFRLSASIAAAVLQLALARERQQALAEQLARAVAKHPKTSQRPAKHNSLNALVEIAAGAAHELNNPLAVISGRAQLLAQAEDDQEKRQILNQIYENAGQASAIVEDLMNYAEPPQPRRTQINVGQMIDEAVQLAGWKVNRDHIDVETRVSKDATGVFVDSAQIVSAIANVIANAVESYGDKPGPVTISGEPDELSEFIKLQVKDQGCGMDPQTLAKATQPFFSARPAGRKRGMGLAYAQRFIQVNQGSLEIESTSGKGTTVTIRLPSGS